MHVCLYLYWKQMFYFYCDLVCIHGLSRWRIYRMQISSILFFASVTCLLYHTSGSSFFALRNSPFKIMWGTLSIVMCMSDSWQGFGLYVGLIDQLQVVTATNYRLELQITIILLLFPHLTIYWGTVRSVFTSSCPVMASNNGYSSASMLKFSLNGSFLFGEEYKLWSFSLCSFL
jgi:hypothetical protein